VVQTTEVDGVPVCWTDVPGPLRAGLVFRTGLVDEPLVRSGWTHAVEHLALAPLGVQPHAYNASVRLVTTVFVTEGKPEEVAAFLSAVCAALRDLPAADRLAGERRILAAEAARRGGNAPDELLMHRFGLDGYGAGARDEWGLPGATAEALRAFATERFTRGAAVAWLSGAPPAGLDLRLPDGPRTPPPDPAPLVADGPHAVAGGRGPALSLLVRGESELTLVDALLRDRLVERLRFADAVAYSPWTSLRRLRGDLGHLVLVADSAPDDDAAAAVGLRDVVDDVAERGVTPEEIATAAGRVDDDDRETSIGRIEATAGAALLGLPPPPERLGTAVAAVPPDRVQEVVAAARDTALLLVREPDDAPEGLDDLLPAWSPGLPGGEPRYAGDDERRRRRIVVTDEGIGQHSGRDQFVTVPWAALSGVLAWDDGTRHVLGTDAFVLRVEPGDVPDHETLRDLIDRYAGPGRIAPQGHREPAAGDVARYEAAYHERREQIAGMRVEQRRLGRVAAVSVAKLAGALALLLTAFALLFWGLAKLVGAGALRFAVPAVIGFLVVGWWQARKERQEG
jgi:hypothetical protein